MGITDAIAPGSMRVGRSEGLVIYIAPSRVYTDTIYSASERRDVPAWWNFAIIGIDYVRTMPVSVYALPDQIERFAPLDEIAWEDVPLDPEAFLEEIVTGFPEEKAVNRTGGEYGPYPRKRPGGLGVYENAQRRCVHQPFHGFEKRGTDWRCITEEAFKLHFGLSDREFSRLQKERLIGRPGRHAQDRGLLPAYAYENFYHRLNVERDRINEIVGEMRYRRVQRLWGKQHDDARLSEQDAVRRSLAEIVASVGEGPFIILDMQVCRKKPIWARKAAKSLGLYVGSRDNRTPRGCSWEGWPYEQARVISNAEELARRSPRSLRDEGYRPLAISL